MQDLELERSWNRGKGAGAVTGIVRLQNRTIWEKSCECKTSLQFSLQCAVVLILGLVVTMDRTRIYVYTINQSYDHLRQS